MKAIYEQGIGSLLFNAATALAGAGFVDSAAFTAAEGFATEAGGRPCGF